MSTAEIGIIFSDQRTEMDAQLLDGYDLDDLDLDAVAEFQAEMVKNPRHETFANVPIEDFLSLLNVYVRKRDGTNERAVTAGGLLFFGKYQSIMQAFPKFQVEYYDKSDILADERYSDRVSTLTDMLNLWHFFQRAFPKMIASVKNSFRLDEQLKRIETGASLEVAIREALVNTLMHANYFQEESIVITNTLNYYDFWNPGQMLVSPSDFFLTLKSKARNSIISALFVYLGLGERSGTGGGLIFKAASESKLRNPEIFTEAGYTTLRIWKADYAASLEGIKIDEDSRNIIKALSKHTSLSKPEIMKITGMTRGKADLRLRKLVEKNIIEMHGKTRATTYTLPMTFTQTLAQLQQQSEVLRKLYQRGHQQ